MPKASQDPSAIHQATKLQCYKTQRAFPFPTFFPCGGHSLHGNWWSAGQQTSIGLIAVKDMGAKHLCVDLIWSHHKCFTLVAGQVRLSENFDYPNQGKKGEMDKEGIRTEALHQKCSRTSLLAGRLPGYDAVFGVAILSYNKRVIGLFGWRGAKSVGVG